MGLLTTLQSRAYENAVCPFTIYKLIDPSTDAICYIGLTVQSLEERLEGHITKMLGNAVDSQKYGNGVFFSTRKEDWLYRLHEQGLRPRIEKICDFQGTRKEAEIQEYRVILAHMQRKHRLYNAICRRLFGSRDIPRYCYGRKDLMIDAAWETYKVPLLKHLTAYQADIQELVDRGVL